MIPILSELIDYREWLMETIMVIEEEIIEAERIMRNTLIWSDSWYSLTNNLVSLWEDLDCVEWELMEVDDDITELMMIEEEYMMEGYF